MVNINDIDYNVIYEWIIKIISCSAWITIGIDCSNQKHINCDFSDRTENNYYAYGSAGYVYCHKTRSRASPYGTDFEKNDEIKMVLNTKNKTLKYFVNNIDQTIAFKDIDLINNKYHFAVCFFSGSSVELISLT